MKSTPIELISTFRKKLSLHTLLILLLIVSVMAGLFIYGSIEPFWKGASIMARLLLAFLAHFVIMRRISLYKIWDVGDPDRTLIQFESVAEKKHKAFHKTTMMRSIAGMILTLGLLLLVLYNPHSIWTGQIFILWLAWIVWPMILGWILMKEQMMVQDLKHSSRDQTSEIS